MNEDTKQKIYTIIMILFIILILLTIYYEITFSEPGNRGIAGGLC